MSADLYCLMRARVRRELAAGGWFICSECGLGQGDPDGSELPSQPCESCLCRRVQ